MRPKKSGWVPQNSHLYPQNSFWIPAPCLSEYFYVTYVPQNIIEGIVFANHMIYNLFGANENLAMAYG